MRTYTADEVDEMIARALAREREQHKPKEPVAWTLTKTLTERETTTYGYLWFSDPQNCMWTPLYTSPPASKPWVGLTQEDRVEIYKKSASIDGAINATITKLREKNT